MSQAEQMAEKQSTIQPSINATVSSIDFQYIFSIVIENLANVTLSSTLANRIAEPHRGMPFMQYLHEPRITQRRRRLSIPTRSVSDVSWLSKWLHQRPVKQMTSSQQECTLLTRLPPEIRLMIYKLVLEKNVYHITSQASENGRVAIRAHTCRYPKHIRSRQAHQNCFRQDETLPRRQHLALLLSCRKVYSEAITMLYNANIFEFSEMSTAFRYFLFSLPEPRLQAVGGFQLYMRVPRHPSLNSRTARDWDKLWELFSHKTTGLHYLHIHLDFMTPVVEEILTMPDAQGAAWTFPIVQMAYIRNYHKRTKIEIVAGNVTHSLSPQHDPRYTHDAMNLHQRFRESFSAVQLEESSKDIQA